MRKSIVAAEVVPTPGNAQRAAKALQQLGFRILHSGGATLSVQGPRQLWQDTFQIQFREARKQRLAESEHSAVDYLTPVAGSLTIPATLQELVADVAFMPPPDLFDAH